MCRAQEAIQRKIAADDPLENRRKIAATAAAAWAAEAERAEHHGSEDSTSVRDLDSRITEEFAKEKADIAAGKAG